MAEVSFVVLKKNCGLEWTCVSTESWLMSSNESWSSVGLLQDHAWKGNVSWKLQLKINPEYIINWNVCLL